MTPMTTPARDNENKAPFRTDNESAIAESNGPGRAAETRVSTCP
jgi:hypothetical protein